MGLGTRIGLTVTLFVLGAVGLGLLKELFGYGLYRAIWSTLIVGATVLVWTAKRRDRSTSSGAAPPEDHSHQTAVTITNRWVPKIIAGLIIGVSAVGLSLFVAASGLLTSTAFGGTSVVRCENRDKNSEDGWRAIDLVIETRWLREPTMSTRRAGRHSEPFVTYPVAEASPTHYRAIKWEGRDASVTLDLDRVDGVLSWTTWAAAGEIPILIDTHCTHKISDEQCSERLGAVLGDTILGTLHCYAASTQPRCTDWQQGSKVVSQTTYTCRSASLRQ
jgi:hypothetical protein